VSSAPGRSRHCPSSSNSAVLSRPGEHARVRGGAGARLLAHRHGTGERRRHDAYARSGRRRDVPELRRSCSCSGARSSAASPVASLSQIVHANTGEPRDRDPWQSISKGPSAAGRLFGQRSSAPSDPGTQRPSAGNAVAPVIIDSCVAPLRRVERAGVGPHAGPALKGLAEPPGSQPATARRKAAEADLSTFPHGQDRVAHLDRLTDQPQRWRGLSRRAITTRQSLWTRGRWLSRPY
jgi:hypothetical protein